MVNKPTNLTVKQLSEMGMSQRKVQDARKLGDFHSKFVDLWGSCKVFVGGPVDHGWVALSNP